MWEEHAVARFFLASFAHLPLFVFSELFQSCCISCTPEGRVSSSAAVVKFVVKKCSLSRGATSRAVSFLGRFQQSGAVAPRQTKVLFVYDKTLKVTLFFWSTGSPGSVDASRVAVAVTCVVQCDGVELVVALTYIHVQLLQRFGAPLADGGRKLSVTRTVGGKGSSASVNGCSVKVNSGHRPAMHRHRLLGVGVLFAWIEVMSYQWYYCACRRNRSWWWCSHLDGVRMRSSDADGVVGEVDVEFCGGNVAVLRLVFPKVGRNTFAARAPSESAPVNPATQR